MAPIDPLRGLPPARSPAADAPVVRAKKVRGVAPATAIDSGPAQPEIDAISEIAALAAGTAATPSNNIAHALYEFIRPRPSSASLLQPARLMGLLGLAAAALEEAPTSHADFHSLGASALVDELRHHQAIAERRAEQDAP